MMRGGMQMNLKLFFFWLVCLRLWWVMVTMRVRQLIRVVVIRTISAECNPCALQLTSCLYHGMASLRCLILNVIVDWRVTIIIIINQSSTGRFVVLLEVSSQSALF